MRGVCRHVTGCPHLRQVVLGGSLLAQHLRTRALRGPHRVQRTPPLRLQGALHARLQAAILRSQALHLRDSVPALHPSTHRPRLAVSLCCDRVKVVPGDVTQVLHELGRACLIEELKPSVEAAVIVVHASRLGCCRMQPSCSPIGPPQHGAWRMTGAGRQSWTCLWPAAGQPAASPGSSSGTWPPAQPFSPAHSTHASDTLKCTHSRADAK